MLYWVIFIFCLLLVLFLILSLLKVKTVIEYLRNGYDDHFVVSFFTLKGLIKYKFEVPLINLENTGIKFQKVNKIGKKEKNVKKEKKQLGFFDIYMTFIKGKEFYDEHKVIICKIREYLKSRLNLKQFNLNIEVGTGDSYYTGIISGILWAFCGILVSYLVNNFRTFKKVVNIKADFDQEKLNVDLYCIFSIRIVHIIIVALMLMLNKKSIKKNTNKIKGGGINA